MRKNLLFTLIVLLIGSGVGYAQTVKVGNLEIMKEDLGEMSWKEAKQACASLGDGWRLPTKTELNFIYENKDEIGGFATYFYWSSTEVGNFIVRVKDFSSKGVQANGDINFDTYGVRAVRDSGSASDWEEQVIIDFPDVEASFPGGAAAMQKWLSENVQYPINSIEMNEQGRVYLSFVVEPNGSITNIVIERGVSKDLDREAKRLMRKMPKWIAGKAAGRKARTRCRLPINFTLN